MTSTASPWIHHVWPLVLGALIALWHIANGGTAWALVIAPALTWSLWQLGRWLEGVDDD